MSSQQERDDQRSHWTVLVALGANVVITAAKAVAFVFTGSVALLAETAHSVADTANQLLLLFGFRQARREPDEIHPFGYGPERYFWPFVYAILIFVTGALIAVWRGIVQLVDPSPIEQPGWAFAVLGIALVFDGGSLINAVRQARRQRASRSFWRFIVRSRDPEVPTVLLEDSAAVSGLVVAFLAIGLAVGLDVPRFDGVGSLVIGVLLAVVAFVLAREMRSLLIGEPATPEEEGQIREVFEQQADVRELVRLRTLHLGPADLLVDSKIRVRRELNADQVARLIDVIEDGIRERLPEARIIAVEPDLGEGGDTESS